MRALWRRGKGRLSSNHAWSHLALPNDPNGSNPPSPRGLRRGRRPERSFEEPAPEITAVGGRAFLAMKLDIEPALPQRVDLRHRQIDGARQHAARRLADSQIGDRGAARALGDTLMQTSDGCRRGET